MYFSSDHVCIPYHIIFPCHLGSYSITTILNYYCELARQIITLQENSEIEKDFCEKLGPAILSLFIFLLMIPLQITR